MKIYIAWTGSNHNLTYILGYFLSRESAEKALEGFSQTAGSPPCGVNEVEVKP